MRSLEELLAYLQQRDIQLWAEGEKLRYNAPKGALTSEIRNELKEHKAELLSFLHTVKASASHQIEAIHPVPRDENVFPLSFNQEQLWIEDQLEGNKSIYNLPVGWRMFGPLNISLLEQSFTEIIRRHEALRTIFPTVQGSPVQKILPPWKIQFPLVDLQHIPQEQRDDEARRLAFKEIERPFELAEGPLFRGVLFRLEPEAYIFVLSIHHIISDVWSVGILVQELSTLYRTYWEKKTSPLPELSIQYVDFASWQRQWLSGKELETQLHFWNQQLAGIPPVLELPLDRRRARERNFAHGVEFFWIDTELLTQLKTLSRQHGVTFFITILAAFAVFLQRYSRQDDIVIGSSLAGRNRTEVEPLIGFFINVLPFRIDVSGNPTFSELLSQVRKVTADVFAHQDVPFVKLVEIPPERNINYPPIFQVAIDLKSAPVGDLKFPELTISMLKGERGTPGVVLDLTLALEETGSEVLGAFEYNKNLFEASTITRMITYFHTLLTGIVKYPQQTISQLPLLSELEQKQILVDWNATHTEYPADACIHQLIEKQTEKTPHAIAVIFEAQQLTYQELNDRANQLAHYLQQFGVGPEVLVGLCVDRSLEMMIGILGVLKAGGAYLPLDPAYPQERLAFMISDAQIPILLTQKHLRSRLPGHHAQVITLDADWAVIAQESKSNPQNSVLPDNLAYVIYTSGSTGKPKGTLLAHRGLCNVAQAHAHYFQLTPDDNVLQFASFSFDSAVAEIVMALTAGATIVLGERETLLPGPALIKFLQDYNISMLTFPPSVLANLPVEKLPALRQITVAGEACSPDITSRWAQGRLFLNLYGPTETTIWATVAQCTESTQKPPIGRPIDNTQVYILGEHFEPTPIGVPGELYIGGVGLARGYLNRPELTAEQFIPNPFSQIPGARLYKTGDLVRYLPDGNLEFLGRIDHQVKLRGFRIELGEIEALLSTHPMVRETAVIIREDRPDQKRLVAYIVPEKDQSSVVNDVRLFLSQKLPDYMVPSAYVILKALPLTPNGKIDRNALPAPETLAQALDETYIAPRTPLETLLTEIWTESLHIKRIGIHDDFFELGGHSLQAARVISKIAMAIQSDVPVKYLFIYPTVARLAEKLEQEIQNQKPDDFGTVAISSDSINDTLHKTFSIENLRLYSSPFFQIEQRSLSALLSAGEIAPIKAAALGYVPISLLRQSGLSHNKFLQTFFENGNQPLLTGIIDTQWGRIGILALPRLSSELYADQQDGVHIIVDALKIAQNIGAQVVSLTGIIPSATDYGCAITRAIGHQEDLPRITTGHATTTAAVVLAMNAVLDQSGRELSQERVGFIGLGSIGISSLSLMLESLPHPQEILLCDVYSKRDHLEKVHESIVNKLGFQGKTNIVVSQTELPSEMYDATFIVGATNVPDILDIHRLQPGTLLVDDSGPHCFSAREAIRRFEEQQDLLFTEGGVLKSPFSISELRYLPHGIENFASPDQIHAFLQHRPDHITGCILSSLLSARFDHLKPTVGAVTVQESLQHYDLLTQAGFKAAPLHCDDYTLAEDRIQRFRDRFRTTF